MPLRTVESAHVVGCSSIEATATTEGSSAAISSGARSLADILPTDGFDQGCTCGIAHPPSTIPSMPRLELINDFILRLRLFGRDVERALRPPCIRRVIADL